MVKLFLINYVENLLIVLCKSWSFLKLKIYVTMCIFLKGVFDVGHITHNVFLAIYSLALTV